MHRKEYNSFMARSDGTVLTDDREPQTVDDEDQDGYSPDGGDPNEEVGDGSPGDPTDPDDLSTVGEVTNSQDVTALQAQIKDLESRIGRLAQANDERLRDSEREWQTWGENYRKWTEEQIDLAYKRGREEAEDQLLQHLDPESKSQYFDSSRESERTRRQQAEAARAQQAMAQQGQRQAIAAQVQKAVDAGVPVDALDQSSPQAVIDSMVEYLKTNKSSRQDATPDEDVVDVNKEIRELREELNRVKRDASGASRTGTSVGGQPRVDRELKEIDARIEAAKKKRDISGMLQLKRQRAALLSARQRR